MTKRKLTLTLEDDADFRYAEALRTLRTNLMFSGSKVRNILITSTHPNEGKSSVSFDLARVFAESGKKTLFIDADIRKSEFIRRYKVREETVGLSQILTGQAAMQQSFYEIWQCPNLDLVMAGPYSPNATELFEDEMCEKFFAYVAEQNYDYVIIDTPPIGTVIDAAILSRFADGAAMVVESEGTGRRMFKRAKEQMDRTGVRFLGVILNKVNMTKGGYYNSYYSYNRYSKYGKYSDDEYYRREGEAKAT